MENPFAFSNYVTGNSFCNRTKELSELLRYIKGSQNVLLYSHRRYGKSSLIRQVFRNIIDSNLNIGAMHVELYGTISEKDFVTKTFQGLNQLESNFERLLKSVGNALKNIKLNLSIDSATGGTSVSPSFEAIDEKIMESTFLTQTP
jgi:AAA+ ATPase superfamily predicted ATPase